MNVQQYFFGSISAFMAHLKNQQCAIHHGLHCYLFELFKPVCRHAHVYTDLVCIKKDEYVIISECIFLSLLRYVLIFNLRGVTSVMSKRAIQLGGVYIHKMFCLPGNNKFSLSRLAEIALISLTSKYNKSYFCMFWI